MAHNLLVVLVSNSDLEAYVAAADGFKEVRVR